MRISRSYPVLTALLLALFLGVPSVEASRPLTKRLEDPQRSQADRERDARDRPGELLRWSGFRKGDVIADVFGGGGYYAELLSSLVGKRGKVLLINNRSYHEYAKKDRESRLPQGRFPNIDIRVVPNDDLGLGEATLDGAIIILSYHDLYYVDPKVGWEKIDARRFLAQLSTALKPGGRLLIVDHAAEEGSGNSAAQDLHRIDERFAVQDFRAAGLEWAGSSPLLRNPQDDRRLNVFDPAIRGKTDRFVHLYRKPRR